MQFTRVILLANHKNQGTDVGVAGDSAMRGWYTTQDIHWCPLHMYDEPVRTEAQAFEASQRVVAASEGVSQPSKLRAILSEHDNVKRCPALYAAGQPHTPGDCIVRVPGMEHNLDQIFKNIYTLLERSMSVDTRKCIPNAFKAF